MSNPQPAEAAAPRGAEAAPSESDISRHVQWPWFFHLAQVVVKTFSTLYWRIHVTGRDNCPASGPLMIVCNHSSHLDPPTVGAWVRRDVRFMAKAELFEIPGLGWLISRLGAYPIRRGASDRAALRMSIDILKAGGVVLMFPEGTRTQDGSLGEPQTGVAMILAQAPETIILPCRMEGSFKVWGPGTKVPRPGKLNLIIGKPFSVAEKLAEQKAKKQLYHELGQEIMARIAAAQP